MHNILEFMYTKKRATALNEYSRNTEKAESISECENQRKKEIKTEYMEGIT